MQNNIQSLHLILVVFILFILCMSVHVSVCSTIELQFCPLLRYLGV